MVYVDGTNRDADAYNTARLKDDMRKFTLWKLKRQRPSLNVWISIYSSISVRKTGRRKIDRTLFWIARILPINEHFRSLIVWGHSHSFHHDRKAPATMSVMLLNRLMHNFFESSVWVYSIQRNFDPEHVCDSLLFLWNSKRSTPPIFALKAA
jgi:hypothetical protein